MLVVQIPIEARAALMPAWKKIRGELERQGWLGTLPESVAAKPTQESIQKQADQALKWLAEDPERTQKEAEQRFGISVRTIQRRKKQFNKQAERGQSDKEGDMSL